MILLASREGGVQSLDVLSMKAPTWFVSFCSCCHGVRHRGTGKVSSVYSMSAISVLIWYIGHHLIVCYVVYRLALVTQTLARSMTRGAQLHSALTLLTPLASACQGDGPLDPQGLLGALLLADP